MSAIYPITEQIDEALAEMDANEQLNFLKDLLHEVDYRLDEVKQSIDE